MPRKPKRTNRPNVGFGYLIPGRERNERLRLLLRLEDGSRFRELESLIRDICPDVPVAVAGDVVNINYQLNIDYFGDVVKKLRAIIALAKAGVIVEGSATELRHGESLILDVADLVGELPSFVARPSDPEPILVGDHSPIEAEDDLEV